MISSILKTITVIFDVWHRFFVKYIKRNLYRSCLGYCGKNVDLRLDKNPGPLCRVYMYDNTNIYHGFRFISVTGKFIMKKNSGAAAGLTVITGNHQRVEGKWCKEFSGDHINDIEKDVMVEEDVWLGANVTLLAGVTIGRGATIGAGAVCLKNIPPYAVAIGNPAKVVGFNFKPEEIIEHEKTLYPEDERLPFDLLSKNYEKYFFDRIVEINSFVRV